MLYAAYDSDKDGELSYADFVRMLNASNVKV